MRTCGRFLHVSADFGSEYTTHIHLSSEMLYAGLTREQSRTPRAFGAAMEAYRFGDDFDLAALPLWFTVGLLVDATGGPVTAKTRRDVDIHTFNSTLEAIPGVQTNDRMPKFGRMETVLPGRLFATRAVSSNPALLEMFVQGQVFWMGKKRTMFQITALGEIVPGTWEEGACETEAIQIGPEAVPQFTAMQVLAATQRCLVVRGRLGGGAYLRLGDRAIPALALAPLLNAVPA